MKAHHVGLAIGVGTLFNPQVLVTENVLHIWNFVKLSPGILNTKYARM